MPTIYKRVTATTLVSAIVVATSCAQFLRADEYLSATDAGQVVKVTAERVEIEIIEKFAKDLELRNRIERVDGFDPAIIEVTPIDLEPHRVRVLALAQGVTTVVLVDEFGNSFSVEIFVKGDARHLQAIIDRKFPDASVEAFKIQESVILRGMVSQPEHITQIVEIAEDYFPRVLNQMTVGGVQQVSLKVKVMEIQRAKVRDFGFNFLYLNRNGFLSSTPGQLVQLGSTTLPFGSGPSVQFSESTLSAASLAFGLIGDNYIFNGFLDALKQESLLKILAEPELVTTNGRPAHMLSGGEFPILVPQSLGTVTIEWREFGVRLQAVPIILGEGRLRLELEPEVSERDFANAVDVNGTIVPGLTTRRVNTQVEMNFGQTIMIAGLISSRETSNTDKIPFFGELPWIGMAFSRKRHDHVETELVILVTPELVAPLDRGQLPPGGPGQFTTIPTDRELYRDGLLEVPNYGLGCDNCDLPQAGVIGPVHVENTHPLGVPPAAAPLPVENDQNGSRPGMIAPPAPQFEVPQVEGVEDTQAGIFQQLRNSFSFSIPRLGRQRDNANEGVQQAGFDDSFQIQADTVQVNSANGPAPRSTSSTSPVPRPSNWQRDRPGLIEPKPSLIDPASSGN